MRKLVLRYQNGDDYAFNILIKALEPMCKNVARKAKAKWTHCTEPIEHLENEARIGVLYAARSYNSKAKTRFLTWAINNANYKVQHYLRDYSHIIHIPAYIQEKIGNSGELDAMKVHASLAEYHHIKAKNFYESVENKIIINQALKAVPSHELEILEMRLGGMTFREISKKLGISHQAVSKRYSKINIRMREAIFPYDW